MDPGWENYRPLLAVARLYCTIACGNMVVLSHALNLRILPIIGSERKQVSTFVRVYCCELGFLNNTGMRGQDGDRDG
jgi:hypothetical protein